MFKSLEFKSTLQGSHGGFLRGFKTFQVISVDFRYIQGVSGDFSRVLRKTSEFSDELPEEFQGDSIDLGGFRGSKVEIHGRLRRSQGVGVARRFQRFQGVSRGFSKVSEKSMFLRSFRR